MPLKPVEKALSELLADAPRPPARGRVLAEEVIAAVDVPPADDSAMDGYAVAAESVRAGAIIPVSQRIAAGSPGEPLPPGNAARIFTGAPIPPGADSVIPQEDCEVLTNGIRFREAPRPGQHVRPRGQDITRGTVVLSPGQRLSAADIGLLASVGLTECAVSRAPVVALLSTGSELVKPGQSLAPGQIYNSNQPLLSGLLQALGCTVIDGGIVADSAEATATALLKAAEAADVVISTGGVSVGEEDHVKAQVERHGRLQLWKLAIKPGKPLAYGRIGYKPFFGLPGNPTSSFVTFCLLTRPYLLRMQGAEHVTPVPWRAIAAFDRPAGKRQEYLRARVERTKDAGLQVHLYDNQSSGVLTSVSWANALVVLPPDTTVSQGEQVDVVPMTELLY